MSSPAVEKSSLQQFLADLPRNGTRIKDRGYRQVWRFEFAHLAYYLKFYPHQHFSFKRWFRGNPAQLEFSRLRALEDSGIAAPRAVADFTDFRIDDETGDAVVLTAIEPAVTLDQYFNEFALRGEPIPDRYRLTSKLFALLVQLKQAGLGHRDLHPGNLLLHEGEIYLLDGYAVHTGGLTKDDIFNLAHSLRGLATRADLLRGWREFGSAGAMPKTNPVSQKQWKKLVARSRSDNSYFGRIQFGNWSGFFFKQYKYPRRWAPASQLKVTADDWQRAWPPIWRSIEAGESPMLKTSPSGDVSSGEIELNGRTVPIVVKRPYRRYWYRYLNEIGRRSRTRRAWRKAWELIAREIPTAWPLLVLQKRRFGYITDAAIVFEKVSGSTLANVDLDQMEPEQRRALFRRTGGVLRKIDQLGMAHFDAKAVNWIVQMDEKLGPRPILIDVDGVQFRRWPARGIERLLRAMRLHDQYTPGDSLELCRGYAPYSPAMIQPAAPAPPLQSAEKTS